VGVPIAVDQTKDSIRVPPVIPETHGDPILGREAAGRAVVAVQRYVGMHGTGPGRRPTLLNRGEGGDPHRISLVRLQGVDSRYEDGVMSYRACKAGNPLLPRCNAGLPERSQRLSSLGAEAKRSSVWSWLALGRQRRKQRKEKNG
jgi:hypothetical protein